MIIINKKQDPKLSDFLARAFFKAWVKVAVVLTAVKLLFIWTILWVPEMNLY